MPKFASGGLMATFSIIPEAAWVSFHPSWVRSISLLCFSLRGGTAFASTMSLAMMSLEVTKFVEFIEQDIVDRANVLLDGPVKVEDL
jgi:hypothetical protein